MFHRRADDRKPPLYSTNYPLRMFVSGRAICVGLIALFELDSVNHSLLVAGEHPAALWTMTLLIICGITGVLDALVNDVLNPKHMVRWMVEHRHFGYLVLTAMNVGFIFITVSRGYSGLALLAYVLDAAAACWIAVYHVRYRYMEPRARAWAEFSGR